MNTEFRGLRRLPPGNTGQEKSRHHLIVMAVMFTALTPALWAEVPADLTLQPVTAATSPVAITHAGDGSDRLFIVEQAGAIRIFDLGTDTLLPTPFLDIQSLVDDTNSEQGLLGLAFHPEYATNGFFYVYYTRDPGAGLDRSVVALYQVSAGDPDAADFNSGVTLLEVEQDFANHNGGDIHFGPDGYLYIGFGDGGSAYDPNNRAQDPLHLLGKMVRIDVDSPPGGGGTLCGAVVNYAIPPDNPFVGDAGTCDEIWALGLRNPWRWSFDRFTGDMLIGDVGQNAVEEIDFQPAASSGGENYGWSCREGTAEPAYNPCLPSPLTDPILEYGHGAECSVTGGFVYRGLIAGLHGRYLYTDYCSGRVWIAERSGDTWSSSEWQDTPYNPSCFGEDEAGELFLADLGGTIYRFTSSETALFLDGFETSDTSRWTSVEP